MAKYGECGDYVGMCRSMVDCCCLCRDMASVPDSVASVPMVASVSECGGIWRVCLSVSKCDGLWRMWRCVVE